MEQQITQIIVWFILCSLHHVCNLQHTILQVSRSLAACEGALLVVDASQVLKILSHLFLIAITIACEFSRCDFPLDLFFLLLALEINYIQHIPMGRWVIFSTFMKLGLDFLNFSWFNEQNFGIFIFYLLFAHRPQFLNPQSPIFINVQAILIMNLIQWLDISSSQDDEKETSLLSAIGFSSC